MHLDIDTIDWVGCTFDFLSLSQTETTLCRRFTVFVTKYNLMSRDNLIVPILEDESAGQGESEA